MAFFKNMAERKRLDDIMDLASSEYGIFLLAPKGPKGDYLILAMEQDIEARVPIAPKVEGGKLLDYPDVFTYADKLLDGWMRDYNAQLKAKGCKKTLSIHPKPRVRLHTELVLELCADYGIAYPYGSDWKQPLTDEQVAIIIGHRSARICFQRNGDAYVTSIGMFKGLSLNLSKSALAKEIGYDPKTGKRPENRDAVMRYAEKLFGILSDAYTGVMEKHGVKHFKISPQTKQYMITLMTNVLCKDFEVES